MLYVHLARPSECFPSAPSGDSLTPHETLNPLLDLVDEQNRADVQKYRFLRDARRCLLGRLLSRYTLASRLGTPWSELGFEKGERGRPSAISKFSSSAPLPIDYNVSHDSDLVAVASLPSWGKARVGVDVMRIRNPWDGCSIDDFVEGISEQLTPSERVALASSPSDTIKLRHALALWTLKEAYVKATGDGLHFDLLRLSFRLDLPTSPSPSSLSSVGIASLDSAPLRGWGFSIIELAEQDHERYFLTIATHEPSIGGDGEVVYYSSPPNWVRGVRLADIINVAENGAAGQRVAEE
ncbi:hypothetical protein JCM11251_005440 [Rhodosporidiobolus azoricus]